MVTQSPLTHLDIWFPPQSAEEVSGVSRAVVRDWRRRRLIDHIGEETNNRWSYRGDHLVQLAVIANVGRVIGLREAADMSAILSMCVISRVRVGLPELPEFDLGGGQSHRFCLWTPRPGALANAVYIGDDVAGALDKGDSSASIVVDIDRLIPQLPEILVEIIKTGFLGDRGVVA